jgi:hypothetical protein
VTAMGRLCCSERTCLAMADANKKLQPCALLPIWFTMDSACGVVPILNNQLNPRGLKQKLDGTGNEMDIGERNVNWDLTYTNCQAAKRNSLTVPKRPSLQRST